MYNELEYVLKYVTQKVEETQLVRLLREMSTLYEQARNTPSPEVTQSIHDKLSEVSTAQMVIQPQGWDSAKIKVFNKLGSSEILGDDGYDNFIKEINSFVNDPQGVSEYINVYADKVDQFKNKIQGAVDSLSSLFKNGEEIPEGMQRVEIVFDSKVAVDTFEDMAQQAKEWNTILKALKLTTSKSGEDGKIWKISKASPTAMVCVLPPEQASSMFDIVQQTLDIVANFLVINSFLNQTNQVPLSEGVREEIRKLVEDGKKKQLEDQIKKSSEKILAAKKLEGSSKELADTSFRFLLKKVYNFFVGGGTVNPIDITEAKGDEEKTKSFRVSFKKTTHSLKTTKEVLYLAEFTSEEKKKVEENIEKSEDKVEAKVVGNKKTKKINKVKTDAKKIVG